MRNRVDEIKPSPATIEFQLWNIEEVSAYLRVPMRYGRDFLIAQPDFPRPVLLPSMGTARGGRRVWKAKDIIKWADERQG